MSRSRADKIAAYVDSPAMFHRIRLGEMIVCEIEGSEGIYVTSASLERPNDLDCSCPSEIAPCKQRRFE